MTLSRMTGAALVGAAVLSLLATGCKSTKKVDEFPKTVEATVEAQGPPEKVDFIEVTPWSAKPGDTVNFRVGGTPARQGTINLACDNGVKKQVPLTEGAPGTYTASLPIDASMPPGKCRVEGTLTGGPSGQPATLVSNRALTIEMPPPPPPPPPTACEELQKFLGTPRIGFAFNRDDLNPEAQAYLSDVASRLQAQAGSIGRVVVEGHCDERGTVNYNLALGARRARAVANLLKKQPGLAGLPIETISRGKEAPLVPNAETEEDHARNRRAVFQVECK